MMRLFVKIDPVGGLWSRCRSDRRCQPGHSQEIIRRGRHFALLFELPSTHESAASQTAHRLAPTEDFLDAFPNALTHLITLRSLPAPCKSSRFGTFIDTTDRPIADGDMRLDAELFQGIKVCAILIPGVGAERARPKATRLISTVNLAP